MPLNDLEGHSRCKKWKLDILQRAHLVLHFRRPIIIVELWRPEVARVLKFFLHICVFF